MPPRQKRCRRKGPGTNQKTKSMKRICAILYTLVAVALESLAQPRFTSNTETHSFGQVEWKRPVTATYTITNTGDKPLVLTNVEPDCACTVAQWTQTPIRPGGKGTISVTFDAKALGYFYKSVGIYMNAEPHLVYLNIEGEVVRELKDYSQTHPYQIGDIRIDREELDFPDAHYGERPVMRLGVVNLSDRPYEPVLMHLPPYLKMKAEPGVLQKGERGVVELTLETERLSGLGLTQTSVYLSRFSGDKVSDENEIPVSAVLLPDFSGLSEAEQAEAPAVSLSATQIDLSQTLSKKKRAKESITITNIGKSALQISKLQVFHPAVGVSLKKALLEPGESTRLRVSVTRRGIGRRHHPLRVLMITNDPKQPKIVINIKAKR